MSEEAPWIRKTEEILMASEESLIDALLTCDGSGEKVKEACLDELLKRSFRKGVISDGRE